MWRNFTADWSILLEKPTPNVELSDAFERASIPSFGFYFMLSLSTIIATLGLLLNSPATIIGAILISLPLGFSFDEVILRAQVRNYIAVVSHREFNDLIDQGASLRSINVETGKNRKLNIEVFVFAPRNSVFQRDVKLMQEFLSEKMRRPVNLKLRVIPFDILEFEVLDPEAQQPK